MEDKGSNFIRKVQLSSIFILGILFLFFETKVGMGNYIFYKFNFQYVDYLNDNIVMLLSFLFILFTAISFLYNSIGKISRSMAFESLLLSLIFIVWFIFYRGRTYYYYGIIWGLVMKIFQSLKILDQIVD